jgi:hypothetical protein
VIIAITLHARNQFIKIPIKVAFLKHQIFSYQYQIHHRRSWIAPKSRNFIKMATSPTPLTRFKEAMQGVYGPFETLTPSKTTSWIPPPKSGGHRGRYLWTDAFGVLNCRLQDIGINDSILTED